MRKGSFFKESQLSLLFPVPNWIQRDSCHAQCHWEVKAGRIRKGQERGSRLQGNKGKPIPLGMILTLETQESADSGSMGSSGGRKQEGTRAGYCTKESVPRSIKTTPPKLQEILLPVQMFEFERCPPCFCWMPVPRPQDGASEPLMQTDIMMVNVSLIHTGRLYPHLSQPLIQVRYFFQPMKTFMVIFSLSRGYLLTF